MPLALDPGEIFPFTFDTDKGRPEPPEFAFRFMTVREWRQYNKFGDDEAALRKLTSDEVVDGLFRTLATVLVGWKRLVDRNGEPVTIDRGLRELERVLTISELWGLYYAGQYQTRLEPEQKKSSGSGSPTDTDGSAGPADAPETPAGAGSDPAT